jgi:hypothetical protein
MPPTVKPQERAGKREKNLAREIEIATAAQKALEAEINAKQERDRVMFSNEKALVAFQF